MLLLKPCHINFIILLIAMLLANSKGVQGQLNYSINDSIIRSINSDVKENLYGKISGIAILNKKGQVLLEQYYRFNNKNTLNQISSVGKSFTSVLVGICLEAGYIKTIKTPIYEYFPEFDSIFRHDSIKKLITIEDLLTQTSGLKWEEWKYPYNYVSNSLIALIEEEGNWIEHFFNLQVDTIPGVKFSYNSLATQILAEILQRTSGSSIDELTKKYIFEPLGIKKYNWDEYPNNSNPAWGGISLTTTDMAKLGLIVLNQGKIGQRTIVSSAWIEKSTCEYSSYNAFTDYAMHWWIDRADTKSPLIYAAGYGDQYVYIIKEKNIVIAINAHNFTDYQWTKTIKDLIERLCEAIEGCDDTIL